MRSADVGPVLLLIIQNVSLVALIRYSRVSIKQEDRYVSSTAVATTEMVKLVMSFILVVMERRRDAQAKGGQTGFARHASMTIRNLLGPGNRRELLLMTVPSALYALQNNLRLVDRDERV